MNTEKESCSGCLQRIRGKSVEASFCRDVLYFHYRCAVREMKDKDSNIDGFKFKKYREQKINKPL